MTVSSTINREQYATDGVTVAFTIHFPFFDDTDVNAIFVSSGGISTTLAINTDFTVSGGDGSGGTLTTTGAMSPLATGGTITIYREIPFTQETDYVEDDPLPADTLEGDIDRAAMRDLQLKDAQDRALTFPVTISSGVSAILPFPSADQFLGWNALGTALENKSVPAGTVIYSSLANTNVGSSQTEAVTPYGLANSNLAVTAAATATLAGVLATLLGTYFSGFALSNNAGDATHDIDVGVGYARDGAADFNWLTTATIVKQTDVAFAEYVAPGTASGGMDSATALTGSPAVVHVFMIGGAGKNTQPFCSTNIAPSLPTGFTNKVYVNSLWWDGTTIRPFKQRGRDEISLVTPPTPVSTTNPATTARTITLAGFPTGVELQAKVSLLVLTTTAAATTGLSALDITDQDAATSAGFDVIATSSTGEFDASVGWVKTNTSGQIRARCSAGGASNNEKITTLGWRVMR